MNDRFEMEKLLNCAKGLCGLLLHGTVESSTPEINSAMNESLNNALMIQNAIYKQMEFSGWYQVTPCLTADINKTAAKLSSQA